MNINKIKIVNILAIGLFINLLLVPIVNANFMMNKSTIYVDNDEVEIDDTIDLDKGYNKLKEVEHVSFKSYLLNDSIYWFPTINFMKVLPPFIYQRNKPSADLNEINNIIEDLLEYDEDPLPIGLITDYDEVRQLVHYFPIKIDESKESITSISIKWHGRATDDLHVRMYCWFAYTEQLQEWFGQWENVISRKSNSSYIWINNTIIDEFPVAKGYINICIVAVPDFGYKSTLFSDYIEVTVQSEELATYD